MLKYSNLKFAGEEVTKLTSILLDLILKIKLKRLYKKDILADLSKYIIFYFTSYSKLYLLNPLKSFLLISN